MVSRDVRAFCRRRPLLIHPYLPCARVTLDRSCAGVLASRTFPLFTFIPVLPVGWRTSTPDPLALTSFAKRSWSTPLVRVPCRRPRRTMRAMRTQWRRSPHPLPLSRLKWRSRLLRCLAGALRRLLVAHRRRPRSHRGGVRKSRHEAVGSVDGTRWVDDWSCLACLGGMPASCRRDRLSLFLPHSSFVTSAVLSLSLGASIVYASCLPHVLYQL